jgi:hypothetical protein
MARSSVMSADAILLQIKKTMNSISRISKKMFIAIATAGFVGCAPESESTARESLEPGEVIEISDEAGAPKIHTHEEIRARLLAAQRRARTPMSVGPLIRNGNNGGLINIDRRLPPNLPVDHDVCGVGTKPSIREAVTCTVPAGERGNRDSGRVGYSTQGRELLAVRMGNPDGFKVAYWTQQHGNEVASTEAMLDVIDILAAAEHPWAREALEKLNILIVVRANPDGGEIGEECLRPPFAVGSVVGDATCALTRYTVDPTAGGGYQSDSEPGFFGVVGRGYDMNRYHHPNLRGAIRPPEVQALVAAMLAFQPRVILDLHGDIGKVACTIDPSSIAPNPLLGGLPNARCAEGPVTHEHVVQFSMLTGRPLDGSRDQMRRRKLGANIIDRIEGEGLGRGVRMTQIAVGGGVIGDSEPYTSLGVHQLAWEAPNMSAVGFAVLGFRNGRPQVSLNSDTGFDPDAVRHAITVNMWAIGESMRTLAEFTTTDPTDDGGYCQIPVASGLYNTLPEFFFGPNAHSEEPALIPLLPGIVPFQYFDDCQ